MTSQSPTNKCPMCGGSGLYGPKQEGCDGCHGTGVVGTGTPDAGALTKDNHTHEYESDPMGPTCKHCGLLKSTIEAGPSALDLLEADNGAMLSEAADKANERQREMMGLPTTPSDFQESVRETLTNFHGWCVEDAEGLHSDEPDFDYDQALAAITALFLREVDRFEGRIDYNAHDMGEMGTFIRTLYVHNFIAELRKRIGGQS